ncbi:hypothetical protein [Lactobacillus delbrueckii]|jgi:peptidoglycan/LPS O-acetylase OafA/YrhL|uniref:hypothetical protein n=1 Tax=Lactobacillus delbrueckii TaxID=1584 RepID=UPI001F2EBBFA|nr:hypothetical protein [Lactobacillus delbrueckii]GHN43046.1 hypothetical protein ME797_04120 [Lactobacillus delbrueckii]
MNFNIIGTAIFVVLGISWAYYYVRLKKAQKLGKELEEKMKERDADAKNHN